MTVPVLWGPREPGSNEQRARGVVQILLLAISAAIVASVVVAAVRVDRVLAASPCGRDSAGCQDRCLVEGTETTASCKVIEGRRYLSAHGLLDDAESLYLPTLLALRELPAVGLLLASFAAAPPPRLGRRRTRLVSLLGLAVLVLLGSMHAAYGPSLGYATDITS